uniref:Glutaredoxin domain-containing protein n=1 Tax=Oryzias sinensis TaxID=183150 RepID=A0A8C7XHK7_9TELE
AKFDQVSKFATRAPGQITVYSIQGCPHCVQAKATLGRLGVPVHDVDVGSHSEVRAKLKELTGRSSVPQIFFNSVYVGGNEELQKLSHHGKMADFCEKISNNLH